MKRKKIRYNDVTVYAIYYVKAERIYYNVNFKGKAKIIIFK